MRDELPEVLNDIARQHGQPEDYEETKPIDLRRNVDWPAVPREGEGVWVSGDASPRTVKDVDWDLETGEIRVSLEDLDTDEMGEEGAVVEYLLSLGWEVDTDMMGWQSPSS